jgi:hypothetical protein
MPTADYELALQIAEKLSPEERVRLARELAEPREEDREPKERLSIMELKGLGKETWEGIDTDAYIKAERDSWDR